MKSNNIDSQCIDLRSKSPSTNGRYFPNLLIQNQIQIGSFGQIFQAFHQKNRTYVAVKLELPHQTKKSSVENEYEILITLQGIKGVPRLLGFGYDEQNRAYLVQDLYGLDLASILNKTKKFFSVKTTLRLGIKLLKILEQIHGRGVYHRDLKPENIMVGKRQPEFQPEYVELNKVYLIDYGVSTLGSRGGSRFAFSGTIRYASISMHEGSTYGIKDDLESLGYVLLFIHQGYLPWTKIKEVDDRKRLRMIAQSKKTCTIKQLCEYAPRELQLYFEYLQTLSTSDKPDHMYLRDLFRQGFKRAFNDSNFKYDWMENENALNSPREDQTIQKQIPTETLKILYQQPDMLLPRRPSNGLIFAQCEDDINDSEEMQIVTKINLLTMNNTKFIQQIYPSI